MSTPGQVTITVEADPDDSNNRLRSGLYDVNLNAFDVFPSSGIGTDAGEVGDCMAPEYTPKTGFDLTGPKEYVTHDATAPSLWEETKTFGLLFEGYGSGKMWWLGSMSLDTNGHSLNSSGGVGSRTYTLPVVDPNSTDATGPKQAALCVANQYANDSTYGSGGHFGIIEVPIALV